MNNAQCENNAMDCVRISEQTRSATEKPIQRERKEGKENEK